MTRVFCNRGGYKRLHNIVKREGHIKYYTAGRVQKTHCYDSERVTKYCFATREGISIINSSLHLTYTVRVWHVSYKPQDSSELHA